MKSDRDERKVRLADYGGGHHGEDLPSPLCCHQETRGWLPLCLQHVVSKASKGPLCPQLLRLWPLQVASGTPPTPLRAAGRRPSGSPNHSPPPRPSPAPPAARPLSSRQCGQRGSGHGSWPPPCVSAEKVQTSFLCHLHGNRTRRQLSRASLPPIAPLAVPTLR